MSFALTLGSFHACLVIGYIAQWLERLTADQQVPGSNPGVPFEVQHAGCCDVGKSRF